MKEEMENRKENNNAVIRLLWTGGWDSTFRLVELSRENVIVQPIYLYGDGRPSIEYERKAKEKILNSIWNRPETKANILPLKEVDINTIPQNPVITNAYNNIIKKQRLGTQYEWIGRYAFEHPGCEICIEKQHPKGIGFMQNLIKNNGALIPTHNIHRYKVESNCEEVRLLIGNVYFPIMDRMEVDMLQQIHAWGYEDVMKHIWFCYTPINGKPCGFCRPCCEKIESDMGFLLPRSARRRYYLNQRFENNKLFSLYYRFLFKYFRN